MGHGAKNIDLLSFFIPRLCQNFILPVHTTILPIFFPEKLTTFFWHRDTWQKETSAFRHEKLGDVLNTSFSRVHRINWWKKRKKNWVFLSVSKNESQIFRLLTKLFLRGSQYCFLLAHRKTLMKENVLLEKFSFFSFSFSDIERQHLAFFVENFPFDLSKLQSLWLKTCRWKPPFLESYLFSFFLFYQRKRLNKTFCRFPEKTGRVVKTAFYVKRGFFFEKNFFLEKTCFLSVWDMGQKNYGFLSFFFPRVCQNFILLSIPPFFDFLW